jgi:hypothetical protein
LTIDLTSSSSVPDLTSSSSVPSIPNRAIRRFASLWYTSWRCRAIFA